MKAVIVIRDGMVSAVLTEENEAIEYRVLDADGVENAAPADTVLIAGQEYYLSYSESSIADDRLAEVFAIG